MNRFMYTLLIYFLLPLTPLKLILRGIKQPEYFQHWGERFGFFSTPVHRPIIWLHCVSVGETRAAQPLVEALIKQYPQFQILLTHSTPTGRATSTQLFGDRVIRAYLPYDTPGGVRRFLRHFQPKVGVLMETELWFNLIAACKTKNLPLLLVNARLSEHSYQGYAKLGKLATEGLQTLTCILAQTEHDASRLEKLGGQQINIVGNLKFDVTPPAAALQSGLALRTLLGSNRPVFLAASTRDGEEVLILEAIKNISIPNLLTLIVPRHPQRFDEVESLIHQHKLSCIRRSKITSTVPADIEVVLGDSMGEMFAYYAASDIAFIGGSLLKYGGQNLIEAASVGKPVLIGPHTFNFAEATNSAITCGAAIRVHSQDELRSGIENLFCDPQRQNVMHEAAIKFTQSSKGATERTLTQIANQLAK